MGLDCNICSNKCYGIPGHHGSCCTIEDRDFIIGPHSDAEEFVTKLLESKGILVKNYGTDLNESVDY